MNALNKMKSIDTWTKQTDKQTTQDNRYQPIPPQGTSDIARGMGLLKQKRESKIKIVKGHKNHKRIVKIQLTRGSLKILIK